jgi:TrmH family RNA methyltransferase
LLKNPNPIFLILENTQDPGNLGAAIRSADAAGAAAVFISRGSVDVFNPKVIRSAAGSVFHLPFFADADIMCVIEFLKNNGINVYGASLDGAECLYSLDLRHGCAFVTGNEARGLKRETAAACTARVKIPIAGKAESLNAAVACGVLVYEALRQRKEKEGR